MTQIIHCLNPIIDKDSRVLILGSIPSEESLRRRQHYAYPGNQFWKIILGIFNSELAYSYDERVAFLNRKHIALWDVLETCERVGSSDSAITHEVANDFNEFLVQFPEINLIFFNGKKAKKLFDKLSKNGTLGTMPCQVLPSTSPANTRSIESKISEWKVIKDRLDRPL